MAKPRTFRDVIHLWPSRSAFAAAIGVKRGAVQQMELRDAINWRHWDNIIAAAERIGHPEITYPLLSSLARRKADKAEAA